MTQSTGGVGADVEQVTYSWRSAKGANATWNITKDAQKDQKWNILLELTALGLSKHHEHWRQDLLERCCTSNLNVHR